MGLRERHVGQVYVQYAQYYVRDVDADKPAPSPERGGNGVISVAPDAALLTCGIHTGDVPVTVELWDSAPPLDTGAWDEAAEVSFHSTTGAAEVVAPMGPPPEWDEDAEVNLPFAGPGSYRLRIHVRGRDDRRDGVVAEGDDPVEVHLIQVWPAPEAPEIRHKLGDEVGAYWRGEDRPRRL